MHTKIILGLISIKGLSVLVFLIITLVLMRYSSSSSFGYYQFLYGQALILGNIMSSPFVIILTERVEEPEKANQYLYLNGIGLAFGAFTIYVVSSKLNIDYGIIFSLAILFVISKIFGVFLRSEGNYLKSEIIDWICRPLFCLLFIIIFGIQNLSISEIQFVLMGSFSLSALLSTGAVIKFVKSSGTISLRNMITWRRTFKLALVALVLNLEGITVAPILIKLYGLSNFGILSTINLVVSLVAMANVATEGYWRRRIQLNIKSESKEALQVTFNSWRRLASISPIFFLLFSWPLSKLTGMIFNLDYKEIFPSLFVLTLAYLVAAVIGPVMLKAYSVKQEKLVFLSSIFSFLIAFLVLWKFDDGIFLPGTGVLVTGVFIMRLTLYGLLKRGHKY